MKNTVVRNAVQFWEGLGGMPWRDVRGAVALIIILLSAVIAATPLAQAQAYSVLHSFQCAPSDGSQPLAGMVSDPAGNLYGTTFSGGSSFGGGTVFMISATGQEAVLYNFGLVSGDGLDPEGGVLRDGFGNLYGTTYGGGTSGNGTVFRVTPRGKETVLYSFGVYPDGTGPAAGLVGDASGNLYGTTYYGGPLDNGTVFEVSQTGVETVLHDFAGFSVNPADGAFPAAGLVRDPAGNLYGTTYAGGTYGFGTVFEVTPGGTEIVLHSFNSTTTDGANPQVGLVRDSVGNLYGTTGIGGAFGLGTVFTLDTTGVETVLYSFSGERDGEYPDGPVVVDAKGNIAGTTASGGGGTTCQLGGCGVVFELTPAGHERVLHAFGLYPDGQQPLGNLVLDHAGNLYGVTEFGGAYRSGDSGCGTVFKVSGNWPGAR
jgi:uncharacterized repeat protein (TIGR03803 family)